MVIHFASLVLLAAVAPAPVSLASPVAAAAPDAATAAAVASAVAQGASWVGTWAAADVPAAAIGRSPEGFTDQTVRDVVHISVGGNEIRVRISNVFGTRPLRIDDVRVALSATGARTVAGSSHRVTFGGQDHRVTIPIGERDFSDPVRLRVGFGQDVAVSIFAEGATGPATWHPAAITTSYYSTPGDHAAMVAATSYRYRTGAWYFLDGVDVSNPEVDGAVVTFGASTSDGVGSTPGANERYPDDLARRLLRLPPGLRLSVLNAGISGNRLLGPGPVSGLARFNRDVLAQTGVRVVVVWLGTNDIGERADITAGQLIHGYLRLIAAAHARGIAIVGCTLQPDEGAGYYSAQGNQVRQQVNRWIRTSGAFDAVVDFDAVLRDPADPVELLPAYDSGDHLHPSDAGYLAMARSISPWVLAALATGYVHSSR